MLFAVTGVLRGFAISLPYNLQLIPFWTGFLLLGAFANQYSLFDHPKLKGYREVVSMILTTVSSLLLIYGVSVLFKRIEVAGVRVKELSFSVNPGSFNNLVRKDDKQKT